MHFQRFAPSAPLQAHVQYFWALESPGDACSPQTFRLVADGCPGLIFQHPAGAPIRDQAGKPWPTLLLHGQTTRPGEMHPPGPFRLVGACLHPSAVHTLFQLPAAELTDACLNVDLLPAPHRAFVGRLQHEPTVAGQVQQLAALLQAAGPQGRGCHDPAVAQVVATIMAAPGRASLPRLRQDTGLSERSFQRRFKQAVGVTPQLFARICRFQASLHQLRAAGYEHLSDVAYDHHYADQSHHIRTFREFTGVSPREYRRLVRPALSSFAALF